MPKIFKNISDKDLDQLFKDAAEKQEPPTAPEGAWDFFYDNHLNAKEKRKKKVFWFTPLRAFWEQFANLVFSWKAAPFYGLVLAIVIWYKFSDKTSQPDKNRYVDNDTSIANIPKGHPQDSSSAPFNTQRKDTLENAIAIGTDKANRSFSQPNAAYLVESTNSASTKNVQLSSSFVPRTSNDFSLSDLLNNNKSLEQEHNAVVENEKKNENDNRTITNTLKAAAKEVEPSMTQPATSPKKDLAELLREQKAKDDAFSEMLNAKEKKEKNQQEYTRSKWNLGVVGGSNNTIVGGNVSSSVGVNAGMMAQRRIAQSRFSVEAGVVRESMSYDLDPNSFHPNGKTVPSTVTNMGGKCTMIDIPVNVRYDVVRTKKVDAFVSTGVSTMWMVNQSYSYQNGDNPPWNGDVTGQGKNVVAVTNVSIGYEQHFKSTSIQIAPYVKVPMGTVGYGNISLASVGAQISIKKNL